MIHLAGLLRRARKEDGGVILLFGIMLPGLLLLAALALEIGNWYEHRRHLQLQTDAGALAAGQLFRGCANDSTAQLTPMTRLAAQYGGDKVTYGALGGGPLVNQQVGSNGPAAGNLPAFSYQGTAYPPDYTPVADTNPCTSGVFDVRATEDSIPHIFGISPLATVHAHSRVEMKAINQLKGLLPLGVPDVRPNYVFATFHNETTNTDIATIELMKGSIVNNEQTWIPKNGPIPITIPTGKVGVRIKLIGGQDPNSTCTTKYTECYDLSDTNLGVVHIRGWDSTATGPRVLDAWLLSGTCLPDAYFTKNDCSAGITADVNLGAANTVDANTHVWATVDGGGHYELTPATTGTGVIRWTLSNGIPISGPGAHDIGLVWKQGSGNNGATIATVAQRAYVASADSGPLDLVQVYEQGVNTAGANSFKGGETHTLGVTIKTIGNLLLSQPTDDPIYLRVFNDSGSASQNHSLNCDKDVSTFRDEIQFGCSPYFIKNPSLACPGGNANNLWDIWYVNGNPLPCVVIKTGATVGQLRQGLNLRIYGTQNPGSGMCATHPVNWVRNVGFDEVANPADPRVLPLIVTPLGSFTGTGGDQVPVIDFGYFYVTGYSTDPCEGTANQDPVPNNRGSYVRGHFIKFFPIEDVVASDDKCDLTSITPCVAVLTR